jgi:hypothetical protein
MIKLLAFLSLFSINALGATWNATSAAQSDVQAAVNLASDGDTVVIPATVATGVNWSTPVQIGKGIALIGQGTVAPNITKINNTVPWNGTDNTECVVVAFGPTEGDKPVRVSNIAFDNVTTPTYDHCCGYSGPDKSAVRFEGYSVNDYDDAYTGLSPLTQVRVDHCTVNRGKFVVACYGRVEGVVDHNTFTNCDIATGAWEDDSASWLRPIVPGTVHSLYIENNTFIVNNNVEWTPVDHQVYCQEGGRYVCRYNTFDLSAYTKDTNGCYFLDVHGNQNYYDPAHWNFRGSPIIEIYNNTLIASSAYQFAELRGGSILFYNNTMKTIDGSVGDVEMWEEECWQTDFFSPLAKSWPREDQINATFFWGNTLNGGAAVITAGNPNTPDGGAAEQVVIKQGRDYWLKPPDSTTATVYPQPAAPSLSSYPLAYVPITSYTPFTYPHPATVTPAPGPTPLPPTGLHVVNGG